MTVGRICNCIPSREYSAVDIATLKTLLSYDPETGSLTWLPREPSMFNVANKVAKAASWNGRYAGARALAYLTPHGYLSGRVNRVPFQAHRVAFALYYGRWPKSDIDHINGNRADNRIKNLREVTRRQNGQNQKMPANNSSGRVGVVWSSKTNMWRAQIETKGVNHYLGEFSWFSEACAARQAAEKVLGSHKNHGGAR
jgi:hypothetical protein